MNRGRMTGDYAKKGITLEDLTRAMAGGAELQQLAHELEASRIVR
jgi:simple sugar transport system ATP-binding protein